MRKDIILLLVLISAGLLVLFFSRSVSPQGINNLFASTTPYPTISLPNDSNVTEDEAITPSASKNIEIISPLTGDSVKSGFFVKGNARTFESTVNIRLLDSSGNVIIETVTTANAPDAGQFGPFEKAINFQTDETSGTLEVFQYSAKDGSEIDKVSIPLAFTR